jgi:hypothetical protein
MLNEFNQSTPSSLIYAFLKLQQLLKDSRGHWPDRAIGPTVPDGI